MVARPWQLRGHRGRRLCLPSTLAVIARPVIETRPRPPGARFSRRVADGAARTSHETPVLIHAGRGRRHRSRLLRVRGRLGLARHLADGHRSEGRRLLSREEPPAGQGTVGPSIPIRTGNPGPVAAPHPVHRRGFIWPEIPLGVNGPERARGGRRPPARVPSTARRQRFAQQRAQHFRRHIRGNKGTPNAPHQDKTQPALDHLLVLCHQLEKSICIRQLTCNIR